MTFDETTKIFRGIATPQLTRLRGDLALLEYSDPGAVGARMSTNTYAILSGARSLLVDVSRADLLPLVEHLQADGFTPTGLVLSHRHTAALGGAVRLITEQFRIPAFLHPLDASHRQVGAVGVLFENPMSHPLLAEFGVDALHFPGHTAGSIMLYRATGGGMLLTGDAAMGPTALQTDAGVDHFVRPPISMNTDDELLREQWRAFDRPLASVLPYHGTGYLDRGDDLPRIMRPLARVEPTLALTG